jgi:hypothetical protein
LPDIERFRRLFVVLRLPLMAPHLAPNGCQEQSVCSPARHDNDDGGGRAAPADALNLAQTDCSASM